VIVVHAGHRIDKSGQDADRFPAERIGSVYRRGYLYLQEHRPTAVVSAAANGADLLVLRAAEDLFIPFHVVLPIPLDEFRRRAVDDRGPDWSEAFDRAIDRAAAVVWTDELASFDDWYRRGNDFILDTANELALNGDRFGPDANRATGETRAGPIRALAVLAGTSSARSSTTADFVQKARRRGWPVSVIDPLHD
jgi:hypothetical protein